MKSIHVDCPTYLELGLTNGEISTVNGKELNSNGVKNVIAYLCQEVGVNSDDVLNKIKSFNKENGAVTLKLYNGAVSTF